MKRTIGTAFVVAIATAVLTLGPPAVADDKNGVLNLVKTMAPDLITSVSTSNRFQPALNDSTKLHTGVRFSSQGPLQMNSVDVTVDYATAVSQSSGSAVVLETADPAVNAVAQSTPSGFRVVTTLQGKPTSNHFEYTFEFSDSTKLIETPNNFLVVSPNRVLGALEKPWAVDSKGRFLRTHFAWKQGVLSQFLDEDISTLSYPVVLDPAWGYIQTYNLTNSPATNFSRLQTCFNCYFPVPGAPKSYPAYGQLLPLKVLNIGNFECTMGPTVVGQNYRAFEFFATKNHVDGYGSNITFQMVTDGGKNYLIVDAYVVNDFFVIGQGAYVVAAGITWQIFANNLNSRFPRT